MRNSPKQLVASLIIFSLSTGTLAAGNDAPASSEVTAAMKPYMDQYKLAGVIGVIAR